MNDIRIYSVNNPLPVNVFGKKADDEKEERLLKDNLEKGEIVYNNIIKSL